VSTQPMTCSREDDKAPPGAALNSMLPAY
jgi:hypothetical protein